MVAINCRVVAINSSGGRLAFSYCIRVRWLMILVTVWPLHIFVCVIYEVYIRDVIISQNEVLMHWSWYTKPPSLGMQHSTSGAVIPTTTTNITLCAIYGGAGGRISTVIWPTTRGDLPKSITSKGIRWYVFLLTQ